tara:strand:+ start:6456 stop:8018 length:1563 start_codon:yes stop_codon:yes gene_type:complete
LIKNIKNRNFAIYLFWILVILFFLKIDYRLTEDIFCCSDDFDYYSHAETIAEDFDFDYKNQLKGAETKRYNYNGKIAPIGFVGSGILSSPFIVIGNFLDSIFNAGQITNFKILLYSFSPIFYLMLSYKLLNKTLRNLDINVNHLLVFALFFGSGITYYVFERFSMSHVFEIFSITLLMFYSSKYFKNDKYLLHMFLSLMLAYQVKWTNYFIFLIPLIVKELSNSSKKIFNNKKAFLIFALVNGLNLSLVYSVYKQLTFNPFNIYNRNQSIANYVTTNPGGEFNFELLLHLKNFINIFFTQEFGIIYFSPVIFLGFLVSIFYFFQFKKNNFKLGLYSFTSYVYIFLVITAWKSPASSYGFRYALCLLPLSILLLNKFLDENNIKRSYTLILISIFALLSTLFFETTPGTQLSLDEQLNTFNVFSRYTQATYLSGFISSLTNLNSYLIIFSTSYLGLFVFKIAVEIFGQNQFFDLLKNLGLPTDNQDFIDLLTQVEKINSNYFVITVIILLFLLKINKTSIN